MKCEILVLPSLLRSISGSWSEIAGIDEYSCSPPSGSWISWSVEKTTTPLSEYVTLLHMTDEPSCQTLEFVERVINNFSTGSLAY